MTVLTHISLIALFSDWCIDASNHLLILIKSFIIKKIYQNETIKQTFI